MKYIRLLAGDMRCSAKRTGITLALCFVVVWLLCLGYGCAVEKAVQMGIISGKGTVWNVAAYFMGGTKYVKMEEVQTIQFPILWGLLYLAGLHLVCDYPFHMAEKTGMVQILSLRSQAGWWMEKLIWTYLTLVAYVGTIVLSICCFCLYRGIPFSSGIDLQVFEWTHVYSPAVPQSDFFWQFHLGIGPVIVLMVLTCVQMAVSQITGPMGGFFCAVFLVGASMAYASPWLVGNLGMVLRNRNVTDTGIDSLTAGYINGFIAAGCLIFWFAAVKIKDNLPKEREEV
ncbi:MAG: hypothetical protein Q4D16_10365 [Eubacteriales bacterium]|nr:hypothetical protein [Eubacteriales bacterium]